MSTLPHPEENNNNDRFTGKDYRDEIISKFSLSKQFAIRQQLSECDRLSEEQAVELLKEAIVQLAHKDFTFALLMKNEI
jgi:hypothetical protein